MSVNKISNKLCCIMQEKEIGVSKAIDSLAFGGKHFSMRVRTEVSFRGNVCK